MEFFWLIEIVILSSVCSYAVFFELFCGIRIDALPTRVQSIMFVPRDAMQGEVIYSDSIITDSCEVRRVKCARVLCSSPCSVWRLYFCVPQVPLLMSHQEAISRIQQTHWIWMFFQWIEYPHSWDVHHRTQRLLVITGCWRHLHLAGWATCCFRPS